MYVSVLQARRAAVDMKHLTASLKKKDEIYYLTYQRFLSPRVFVPCCIVVVLPKSNVQVVLATLLHP